MSLMAALLETYNFAFERGLVDNPELSTDGLTLLPLYHSSRVSSGQDVFEITIDKNSNAIDGQFLEKGQVVIFPITEDSIIRSGSKIAPHAISDELSYLSPKIDANKNSRYMEGIKELLDYEKDHSSENFRIIGNYIIKNTILDNFLKFHLKSRDYSIDDKFKLSYEETTAKGKVKKKSINLKKVFITFKLAEEFSGDITLTRDVGLHKFYIDYVKHKNSCSKEWSYCDITGKLDYCVERHRGLIGNAKLISVSNHHETYYGRLKEGKDIYRISYEASQKVHNMLKYLIENSNHASYIGEGAYLINWLSQDLGKGGVQLVSDMDYDDEEDFEDVEDQDTMEILGGRVSDKLKRYFLGEDTEFNVGRDFHVLIIEKVSNGRVSIKYYRRLSRSEAYERVLNWYKSTKWRFYKRSKSPSLYEIVNFTHGSENKKGFLSCENKKLFRSTIERLIPCVIDAQKLPRDITRTTFYRLSKKQSFKNSWNTALSIGCALIKKYKNDYENYLIDIDKISEVEQLAESRSFHYGKLMAIYEKIELDAVNTKDKDADQKKGKNSAKRITNSDRLWSSMIRTPERTRFILESKIKPYQNMLKKNNPGLYVFYDKLITQITMNLMELAESEGKQTGSLNEDFILGYYYQKNGFYQKKVQ